MFVILNKPHGLLVHPTDSSDEYTLRDFLIENFNISVVGEYKREGIVHRLDRVTSGLIVCPINMDAFNQLQEDFKKRKIIKKYKAIVQGSPRSKSGEINLPLIHSQNNRRKREVGRYSSSGDRGYRMWKRSFEGSPEDSPIKGHNPRGFPITARDYDDKEEVGDRKIKEVKGRHKDGKSRRQ